MIAQSPMLVQADTGTVFTAVDGVQPGRAAGPDPRLSRPERRRQDHHHPDDCRPPEADRRAHRGQRPRPGRPSPRPPRRRWDSFRIAPSSTRSSPRASSCAFTAGCTGSTVARIEARIREMLDLFELARWRDELVESFSHGMKQRLVMSAAFMHRPRAVLVDEPMVGLDPRGARLIKDVFRRMADRGVAILMSTHTLEVAQEVCDRVSIILKGRIIASGTVDDVRRLSGQRRRAADRRCSSSSPAAAGSRRSTKCCDGGIQLSIVRRARPFPYLSAAVLLGVAQPRAAARTRRPHARGAVRRHRLPGHRRDHCLGRVLGDAAA